MKITKTEIIFYAITIIFCTAIMTFVITYNHYQFELYKQSQFYVNIIKEIVENKKGDL